jgi:hypothetical protein
MGTMKRALLAGLLVAACQKPIPPEIRPKEAIVTGIGPQGLSLRVTVEATNKNAFELAAQSMTAKVRLVDPAVDLGTATVPTPITLPPNAPTPIPVQMTVPWSDVRTLAMIAMAGRPVDYVVDGTVRIGGRLQIELPVSVRGTITREQAAAAALKALPGLGVSP